MNEETAKWLVNNSNEILRAVAWLAPLLIVSVILLLIANSVNTTRIQDLERRISYLEKRCKFKEDK